jgi:hypothetical protein
MKDGLKKQMADKAMGLVYATVHIMGLDSEGAEKPIKNGNSWHAVMACVMACRNGTAA